MLDADKYEEWLTLLDPSFTYKLICPTVRTWKRTSDDPAPNVLLLDETMGSLVSRVKQLSTAAFTVSENPRSLSRRFVTNVFAEAAPDDQLTVYSNVLVYRSRLTQDAPNLFAISRIDRFVRTDGGLRLKRRDAELAETIVRARNIATLF